MSLERCRPRCRRNLLKQPDVALSNDIGGTLMNRLFIPAAAVLTFASLGGCAQMQENVDDILSDTGLASTAFECDDDRNLQLSFADGGEEATIRSRGETVRLDLVDTRENGGTRIYENRSGSVRMIDEGDEVHVRIDGKENFDNCQPEDGDRRR